MFLFLPFLSFVTSLGGETKVQLGQRLDVGRLSGLKNLSFKTIDMMVLFSTLQEHERCKKANEDMIGCCYTRFRYCLIVVSLYCCPGPRRAGRVHSRVSGAVGFSCSPGNKTFLALENQHLFDNAYHYADAFSGESVNVRCAGSQEMANRKLKNYGRPRVQNIAIAFERLKVSTPEKGNLNTLRLMDRING